MDPVNVPTKFEVLALPIPEKIATEVLGWVCETPIVEESVGGAEDGTVRKSVDEFL